MPQNSIEKIDTYHNDISPIVFHNSPSPVEKVSICRCPDHPVLNGEWLPAKLDLAADCAKSIGSTSVMVFEDHKLVWQWGDCRRHVQINSLRKSMIGALLGIYAEDGAIDLSRTLEQLGINDDVEPVLSQLEQQATVGDLLAMKSGVYHPAAWETQQMKERRPERHSHVPGTFWHYNNWDANTLGTILEKETGKELFESFNERIAIPLGMEDFHDGADTERFFGPESSHPAYLLKMSARDVAKFGSLYLHNGEWSGRQLVPKDWILESTEPRSKTGRTEGYGFLWWATETGEHFGVRFHGPAYSARGYRGQFLLVVPGLKLVVVHLVDYDVTRNAVREREFSQLLRLVLDAKPTAQSFHQNRPGHVPIS